jgi:ribosomal protein S12 methylthiotransferase accessory factor
VQLLKLLNIALVFAPLKNYMTKKKLVYLSVSELDQHDYYIEKDILPRNIYRQPYCLQKTYWAPYQHITDPNRQLLYPVFLQEPRYHHMVLPGDQLDINAMAWKAADTGTASGTNLAEALIHGLNEVIERDATSLFYIDAFVRKAPYVRIIDPESMPVSLQTLLNRVATESGSTVYVFDITSNIQIPSACVATIDFVATLMPKGYGTSLNRKYAVERAALEVLQPIQIRNEKLEQDEQKTVESLAPWPLLQRAAIGDLRAAITAKSAVTVAFDSLPDITIAPSLDQQLTQIADYLNHAGFDAYFMKMYENDLGVTCVRLLVPSIESFYLVCTGKRVLPGPRGQERLTSRR